MTDREFLDSVQAVVRELCRREAKLIWGKPLTGRDYNTGFIVAKFAIARYSLFDAINSWFVLPDELSSQEPFGTDHEPPAQPGPGQ